MIESERQTPAVVLFVDDEEKSRKYFQRVFGEGREILTASNGREALEVYERHAAQIGIVVTDQIMPRLTGLQLLEELQAGGLAAEHLSPVDSVVAQPDPLVAGLEHVFVVPRGVKPAFVGGLRVL